MSLTVNEAYALISSDVVIGGAKVEGITKFDYKVTQEKTNNKGANGRTYSRSRKGEEYEANMTLFYREVLDIMKSAGVASLTRVAPFDLVVNVRAASGEMVKHTFIDIEFTESGTSLEVDSDDAMSEVPCIFSDVQIAQ